ncbi:MAG: DUF2721 domain-containing protein [Ignavibacteriae bacterium]|nr:DUF2721 domain-containing protein [Ignavibacteriota bacterium]
MGADIYFKTIQLMLAPAVMISACGLLLLGISNKYSSITNRLRILNEERRRHHNKMNSDKELDYFETTRLQSISSQLQQLLFRLKLVRNVILFYVLGLFLFIFTSLLIGIDIFLNTKITDYIALSTFILGLISVGIGLIYSLTETLKGYKILELEIKAE